MESPVSRRLAPRLAHQLGPDADAAHIADVIVSTWQEIGAALRPLIGPGGVAALYTRSIHLAGSAHPWLAVAYEAVPVALDLPALRSVLAQQSIADASAGGFALLETIYALLTNLVGSSLTDELLGSVSTLSRPPAAQDKTP
jgi:hypothetical protein